MLRSSRTRIALAAFSLAAVFGSWSMLESREEADAPVTISDGSLYVHSPRGWSLTNNSSVLPAPTTARGVSAASDRGAIAVFEPDGRKKRSHKDIAALMVTIKFKPASGPAHWITARTDPEIKNLSINTSESAYRFDVDPADPNRLNYVAPNGTRVEGQIESVRFCAGCLPHDAKIGSKGNKVVIYRKQ